MEDYMKMKEQGKKQKKAGWVGMAVLLLFLSVTSPASAQDTFNSAAESAILMEASTGQILYEKNADTPLPPASITKIMTLLLGFEALDNGSAHLEDPVTVSEKAWRTGMEGSEMFLDVGSKVPLRDILTGISVVSANDGCVALAEHLYGSEEVFVGQMNKRAKELGMTHTEFKNCNGLPAAGHHMSAHDIAILAGYLITNYPKVLELESTKEFTFNGIYQKNRNPLLENYPGADGLKTGWTEEAGFCLVGTAKKDGMRLISVVLKTRDEKERLAASKELLDFGYRNFELTEVVKEGKTIGKIPIRDGRETTVPVKVNESITAAVPKSRKADIKISAVPSDQPILAPVAAGKTVGKAEVRLGRDVLATADICTTKKVEKIGFITKLVRGIADFFRSLFKVSKA
jgi:D-alanyl-D-alanine carboxypeptidase (penicillin-binding protein 5/6)